MFSPPFSLPLLLLFILLPHPALPIGLLPLGYTPHVSGPPLLRFAPHSPPGYEPVRWQAWHHGASWDSLSHGRASDARNHSTLPAGGAHHTRPHNAAGPPPHRSLQLQGGDFCANAGAVDISVLGDFAEFATGYYGSNQVCSATVTNAPAGLEGVILMFTQFDTVAGTDTLDVFFEADVSGTPDMSFSGSPDPQLSTLPQSFLLPGGGPTPYGVGLLFNSGVALHSLNSVTLFVVNAVDVCNNAEYFTELVPGGDLVLTVGWEITTYASTLTSCWYSVGAPAGYVTAFYFSFGYPQTVAGSDALYFFDSGVSNSAPNAASLPTFGGVAAISGDTSTDTNCGTPPFTGCSATGQYAQFYFTSGPNTPASGLYAPLVEATLVSVSAGYYRTTTGYITPCAAGKYSNAAAATSAVSF